MGNETCASTAPVGCLQALARRVQVKSQGSSAAATCTNCVALLGTAKQGAGQPPTAQQPFCRASGISPAPGGQKSSTHPTSPGPLQLLQTSVTVFTHAHRASRVFPVPGGPQSSTPRGMREPEALNSSGLRKKSTTSISSTCWGGRQKRRSEQLSTRQAGEGQGFAEEVHRLHHRKTTDYTSHGGHLKCRWPLDSSGARRHCQPILCLAQTLTHSLEPTAWYRQVPSAPHLCIADARHVIKEHILILISHLQGSLFCLFKGAAQAVGASAKLLALAVALAVGKGFRASARATRAAPTMR